MMSPQIPGAAEAPPIELCPAERFLLVNRERLRRARELLDQRQRDVLDVLPYLFHVNHPQLPGHCEGAVPLGIIGYTPDSAALAAASRLSRRHRFVRRALKAYDIVGLYLMGSIGSIAQTPSSDFDVWVCHPRELPAERRRLLVAKAAAIERWAAEFGVEVHCFVFCPEEFADGSGSALSTESSGSSQHYLLLDEFYRSGLVLAGQLPRWGFCDAEGVAIGVPPLPDAALADFGELRDIPAREFFGAAIWQVYKSLGAPYKSVLKLLLMEAYAAEYPDCDLLCHQFRRAVLAGQTDLDALDPYLRMYRKVEAYLEARGDRARLELARRCLYLKVGVALSHPPEARRDDWRREAMQRLVREWGWDSGQVLLLDNQPNWRFHNVQDEGRALMSALTTSYRAISGFARARGEELSITQADLTALGRKLYAAFERRPGKLEVLNRGITQSLVEDRLSFHHQIRTDGEERWLTFLERVLPDEIGNASPVRRSPSLVDALMWCHVNGLLARHSVLTVLSPGGLATPREARQILDVAAEVFPGGRLHDPDATELAAPQTLIAAALFVNAGSDPLAGQLREGQCLASDRSNALSFGALHVNLARSFDLVLSTSWGEAYVHRYAGPHALLDCLQELLRWITRARPTAVPSVHVVGGSYASTIQRRIQTVVCELFRGFAEDPERRRFVVEVAGSYYVLQLEDGEVRGEIAEDRLALLRILARPAQAFHRTLIDPQTLVGDPVALLMQVNRPGVIQLVLDGHGEECEVYVVDECGGLFHQQASADNRNALIEHLQRFFRTVTRRKAITEGQALLAVETYTLRPPSPPDGRRLARLEDLRFDSERPYLEIKVLIHQQSVHSRREYTILCGDREFSSLEHGGRLFSEVAAHVRELRRSQSDYPLYITDVDLRGNGAEGRNLLPVSQLLQYKRTIEEHLNRMI
jgi:adenylate cyclase class 1